MTSKYICDTLDEHFEARCELNYTRDYELLIAVVLSAQCTDKRVNEVTKVLFAKYDLEGLKKAPLKEIEQIIKPCGTYTRKAEYIKKIAIALLEKCDGLVPNDREFLESLPGVGRKTCNVVLSNLYNVPAIAVDTHVERVSKRLGLCKPSATVLEVENQLMKFFPKEKWSRVHHQLVLFGRYICVARNPKCDTCPFKEHCKANYNAKKKR